MYLGQSRLALPFAFLTIADCNVHIRPKSDFNHFGKKKTSIGLTKFIIFLMILDERITDGNVNQIIRSSRGARNSHFFFNEKGEK